MLAKSKPCLLDTGCVVSRNEFTAQHPRQTEVSRPSPLGTGDVRKGGQWEMGRWLQGVCGLNDLGRLDRLNGGSAAEGNRDLNLSGIEGTFRILCFNSWEFGEVGQF